MLEIRDDEEIRKHKQEKKSNTTIYEYTIQNFLNMRIDKI